EQVRREDDRAAAGDEVADEGAEVLDPGWVEAVHRLVPDQQLPVREQAAREAGPVPPAERGGLHAGGCAGGGPAAGERVVDPAERIAAAGGRDDPQVLPAGQVSVEARLLDDRADASKRLSAARWNREAEQLHRAFVRMRQPEQHADERRLAGAVRAEV